MFSIEEMVSFACAWATLQLTLERSSQQVLTETNKITDLSGKIIIKSVQSEWFQKRKTHTPFIITIL